MSAIVPEGKTVSEYLPTLPQSELCKLSPKEIWELGTRHLREQKEKSMHSKGCAYRGYDGNKCAAGVFISNEEYDSCMENVSISSLTVNDRYIFDMQQLEVLRTLQSIHDAQPVNKWEEKIKNKESCPVFNRLIFS